MKIKDTIIDSPIVIAPMAGISNDAFRQICLEFDAGLVYSEMVSDKAIYYENKKTLGMLEISSQTHPISLQLFGKDIDTMVYAAKVLDNETTCDFIDINMGCPVNKVVKTGAGSALMLKEDETVEMVKAVVENVNKPVTVKMRLGYDKSHMNYLSLAKKLENVGVSCICLHARTRSQMYEGHSDWSHIKELKKHLSIPVIGNGDVKTVDDFIKMREQTSCDGVMIGRAVVGNPFLIKEISNYLNGSKQIEVSCDDKLNYCLKHCQKLVELVGERNAIRQMRGIGPHYISGLYMASKYKDLISKIDTYKEFEKLIEEYRIFLKTVI